MSTTSTLEEARAHARAQAGAAASTYAVVPPSAPSPLPAVDGVAPGALIWDELLGAGGYRAAAIPRDAIVRITDIEGDGCVHILVFNARQTSERLNIADTVKVQWQAYLAESALLLSDMGRVLMTLVSDTSGRHDALCGCANRARNDARYGAGSGAVHASAPNTRDLLCLGLAKSGLDRRDLAPGVNLFKGVRVGDDGSLRFDGEPRPGTAVELRAEKDLIVAIANAPHPLDPRPQYVASPVRVTAWRAERPEPDPFRASSTERLRAFENSETYLLGVTR